MSGSPGNSSIGRAVELLQKKPGDVLLGLLKDSEMKQKVLKKIEKMVKNGKIPANNILKAGKLEKKIQKKASAIKAKTVFQLVISSPAIKGRFEADPYDDCLMEDFGDLADHFYDGSDVEEMHQKLESAVQKAWEFISENLMDDDIDEKELRHLVMGR